MFSPATRWYLEDCLEHPFDPNPRAVARWEARLVESGTERIFNDFRAIGWVG